MLISIIVAAASNGVIGKDNKLLWHLPNDLKHFKALTLGHPIIMGRKTYESIGKPLPGRTSIIVTNNKKYRAEDCLITHSLKEAIAKAQKLNTDEAFIIGGAQLYQQAISLANRIYFTKVSIDLEGDACFKLNNEADWEKISEIQHYKDDKHLYDYEFSTYNKKITTTT